MNLTDEQYNQIVSIAEKHIVMAYGHFGAVESYRNGHGGRLPLSFKLDPPIIPLDTFLDRDIDFFTNKVKGLSLGKDFFIVGSETRKVKIRATPLSLSPPGPGNLNGYNGLEYACKDGSWTSNCLGGYYPNSYSILASQARTVPELCVIALRFAGEGN